MTTAPTLLPDADLTALVLQRTVTLCEIPAPPLHEAARAHLVQQWWNHDGIGHIDTDEVGNLWGQLRPGRGPALLVCAHLDTVFGEQVLHGVHHHEDKLVGPGVGDDAVAVASLSVLDTLLPAQLAHPVWIVATVGEEGLGNLRGITHALDQNRVPVGAVLALEGNYLGQVNVVGVGSVRRQITVHGPGGHAWEAAQTPSSVHLAADLVSKITAMAVPQNARTSVNIGTIHGGESVNSRAQTCTFQLDLRADTAGALSVLVDTVDAILADIAPPLRLDCIEIGQRPAGRIEPEHPLVRVAMTALHEHEVPARMTAASTDANAAYARGIPAITLGVTIGADTHTENEWILIEPLPRGLAALAATITAYDLKDW